MLFGQLYDYAMKNDICNKNYSEFVDITKYKNRNPNKMDRNKFTKENIECFWNQKDDKYYQIVLMLIYTGVRISELLDLKKENVFLGEQYFDVLISKTENGIRKVPIADKILPFLNSGMKMVIVNIFYIQKMGNNSNTVIIMIVISYRL